MFKRRILIALFSSIALPLAAAGPDPMQKVTVWLVNKNTNMGEVVYVNLPSSLSAIDFGNAVLAHFGFNPQLVDFRINSVTDMEPGTVCTVTVTEPMHDLLVAMKNQSLWECVYKLALQGMDTYNINESQEMTQARALVSNNMLFTPYARERACNWYLTTNHQTLAQINQDRGKVCNQPDTYKKELMNMFYAIKANCIFDELRLLPYICEKSVNGRRFLTYKTGTADDIFFGDAVIALQNNPAYLDRAVATIQTVNTDATTDDIILTLNNYIDALERSANFSIGQRDLLILLRDTLTAKEAALAPQSIPQSGTPGANNLQLNPPVPTNNPAPSSQWRTWAKYGGMTVIVLTAAYFGYQWFVAAPAQTSEETKPA